MPLQHSVIRFCCRQSVSCIHFQVWFYFTWPHLCLHWRCFCMSYLLHKPWSWKKSVLFLGITTLTESLQDFNKPSLQVLFLRTYIIIFKFINRIVFGSHQNKWLSSISSLIVTYNTLLAHKLNYCYEIVI